MKRVLLLSLCTLLTACSSGQPQGNTGKYKPVVNPHPQYFLTINLTNELPDSSIKIITTYMAMNSKCDQLLNRFEGAKFNRVTKDSLNVNTEVKKLMIPIDKYYPGLCEWGASSVDLKLENGKNTNPIGVIFFDAKQPVSGVMSINETCKNKQCDDFANKVIPTFEVNRKQNILFKLAIKPE